MRCERATAVLRITVTVHLMAALRVSHRELSALFIVIL
jgi:hypothetical protein